MAPEGSTLTIVGLRGNHALDHKFLHLGLNPGASIKLQQRINGSAVVSQAGARLAVGAAIAHMILVTPTPAKESP